MIVLDTNVASELMRPSPSPVVEAWVRARSARELYTTSITVAEIRYGIERLPEGHRKDLLRTAAADVFSGFAAQILPFDAAAAAEYAEVASHRERLGAPIEGFDAQIGSICRTHHAALATRNAGDFADTAIDVINPWHDTP